MDTRTQSTPEWLTPLLRYPLWREAELVDILCGLSPRTARERKAMPRAQFDEEADRRQAAERYVKDAIQRGELLVEPSLADQRLLDKIVPHVDDPGTLDRITRAVFAAPLYEPRKVRPDVAIAWALSRRDLFPHSPLRVEHRAAAEAPGVMPAPTFAERDLTPKPAGPAPTDPSSGEPPLPRGAVPADVKDRRQMLVKQALRRKGVTRTEFLRTNGISDDVLRGVVNGAGRRVKVPRWTPKILSLLDITEDDWNTA